MSIIATLKGYGMGEIGVITMPDVTTFRIVLHDTRHGEWQKAIYAFVVGNEVMRIGSSKGKLYKRFQGWNKDVSNALRGDTKATRSAEANSWATCLEKHGGGLVFGRIATLVTTPVGTFEAYMDEESVLINRFKPSLNNHTNR